MGKKSKKNSVQNGYMQDFADWDIFDETLYDAMLYDESSYDEYQGLEHSAISEGADAKDIFNQISRELPPRRLKKPAELTEAQKLSKLGAASAKAKNME